MRKIIIALIISVLLSRRARSLSLLTVSTALASPLTNVTNNEIILNSLKQPPFAPHSQMKWKLRRLCWNMATNNKPAGK